MRCANLWEMTLCSLKVMMKPREPCGLQAAQLLQSKSTKRRAPVLPRNPSPPRRSANLLQAAFGECLAAGNHAEMIDRQRSGCVVSGADDIDALERIYGRVCLVVFRLCTETAVFGTRPALRIKYRAKPRPMPKMPHPHCIGSGHQVRHPVRWCPQNIGRRGEVQRNHARVTRRLIM